MTLERGIMVESNGNLSVDCQKQQKKSAFTLYHLYGFLFCWVPANPLVLFILSAVSFGNASITFSALFHVIYYITLTILGPFASLIEGRNHDYCLNITMHILPICLGAIIISFIIQILWRPRKLIGELIRQLIWVVSWLIWFGGGAYSLLSNMG